MIYIRMCTASVAYAAKRAWNWEEAPCGTVVTHGARAIPGEVGGALWCRLHSSALAEITLQTRTLTKNTNTINLLLNCSTVVRVCSFCILSPWGVEAPYEPQYTPEGQGAQTEREWAPVWLLKVPKGHGSGRDVPAGQKWPWKRACKNQYVTNIGLLLKQNYQCTVLLLHAKG